MKWKWAIAKEASILSYDDIKQWQLLVYTSIVLDRLQGGVEMHMLQKFVFKIEIHKSHG